MTFNFVKVGITCPWPSTRSSSSPWGQWGARGPWFIEKLVKKVARNSDWGQARRLLVCENGGQGPYSPCSFLLAAIPSSSQSLTLFTELHCKIFLTYYYHSNRKTTLRLLLAFVSLKFTASSLLIITLFENFWSTRRSRRCRRRCPTWGLRRVSWFCLLELVRVFKVLLRVVHRDRDRLLLCDVELSSS